MAKRRKGTLGYKVALAVELTIFFYVFSIAVAALLVAVPYLEWHYLGIVHFVLFLCPVAGVLIVASLFPRRRLFLATGTELTEGEHAELFSTMGSVARALGTPLPGNVYLTARVDVSITTRDGRRILELGLPLLETCTVSDLRTVLAQELTVVLAGDMKLGPWIHATRERIVGSFEGLDTAASSVLPGCSSAIFKVLGLLFNIYGSIFLRLTTSISREQEFLADEAAARLVGPRSLARALRKCAVASAALQPYAQTELLPLLRAGFRPPLMEGFGRYLAAGNVLEKVTKKIDADLELPRRGPYDAQPPLADRLAALDELEGREEQPDDRKAISLLCDLERLERLLVPRLVEGEIGRLVPLPWSEVGTRHYLPLWETTVRENAVALSGLTPLSFGEGVDLGELGKRFGRHGTKIVDPGAARRAVFPVAGAAIAVALAKQGFEIRVAPGTRPHLVRGEETIDPFSVVRDLEKGELAPQKWWERCSAAGIATLDLGALLPPATDEAPRRAPLMKRGKKGEAKNVTEQL